MLFGFNAAEVFDIAIEIEENGKAFYEQAIALVDDPDVKELLADLARQEVEHKNKFLELKAGLPGPASAGTVYDPDQQVNEYLKMMADQHVFRTGEGVSDKLEAVGNATDALKMAIEFEKDTIIFFLSMQDATDEKKGRELIALLIKEEQEHLRRLSVELRKIDR